MDHPREYGENETTTNVVTRFRGSSPRIRGKWDSSRCQLVKMGIIPANTGKISRAETILGSKQDHPREYGENIFRIYFGCVYEGSSPRIRGKLAALRLPRSTVRIIPANTGKIARRGGRRRSYGDHPREYGENIGSITNIVREKGSSPRIRGKLLHHVSTLP